MTSIEPAHAAVAVTPSDDNDLTVRARSLYVGGAGNVSVILTPGTSPVLFTAVPAGTILPLHVSRVRSTGTTATAIVALW